MEKWGNSKIRLTIAAKSDRISSQDRIDFIVYTKRPRSSPLTAYTEQAARNACGRVVI